MDDDGLCSKCLECKSTKDFNKVESKKPASERICNACGPPLPTDLSILTVVQIKAELTRRGETNLVGKKAELVKRLQQTLLAAAKNDETTITEEGPTSSTNSNMNAGVYVPNSNVDMDCDDVTARSGLTLEHVMSLKVVDLKKELKSRGLPAGGLKAALQKRLADAVKSNTKEEVVAVPVKDNNNCPVNALEAKMSILTCVDEKKNIVASPRKESTTKKSFLSKDKKVTIAEQGENDTENMQNGVVGNHWKRIPPNSDREESLCKVVNDRTFFWCTKCKLWAGHKTAEHIKKKKSKNNKKKAIPLIPCTTPGGRPLGLPMTPGTGRILAEKPTPAALNQRALF